MFRSEQVQERLQQVPFQPFRLVASEGLRYEIRHPDLVLVGERDLMIGHPSKRNPDIYDGVTRVALMHVIAIQELTPDEDAAPATPNGTTAA